VHQHDAARNHITVVTRGRFRCLGKQEGRVIQTGEMVAWEIGEPHGMEALADDSRFLNIRRSEAAA
jgi:quercetin dioxygenase-like cupin family protein